MTRQENIWFKVIAHGPSAATKRQIFSCLARPNSDNKYFLIIQSNFDYPDSSGLVKINSPDNGESG